MNQRIILFTILLYLASSSYSQKILKITSVEEANALIQDHIEVYVDSTNLLDFNQVSSKEYAGRFIPVSVFEEETTSENTYWLHFILDYDPVECVPMGMQISGQNYFTEIYSLIDGSVKIHKTGSGRTSKLNDELLPYTNYILVEGNGQIEYYLKLNTVKFRHPDFEVTFYDLADEFREDTRLMIFLAITML